MRGDSNERLTILTETEKTALYTRRPEKTQELGAVAHHARSLVVSIEERLLKEYRKNT